MKQNEKKITMITKKVLRFPISYYVLDNLIRMLRSKGVNRVYRSDLEFDNVYDIVDEWIRQFNPNLVYNANINAMPYLESAICESGVHCCYLDLVFENRTHEIDKVKGYVLCRDINGSEYEMITKLGYLDALNPSLRQLYTIRSMEISWSDTEDQPDGYVFKTSEVK